MPFKCQVSLTKITKVTSKDSEISFDIAPLPASDIKFPTFVIQKDQKNFTVKEAKCDYGCQIVVHEDVMVVGFECALKHEIYFNVHHIVDVVVKAPSKDFFDNKNIYKFELPIPGFDDIKFDASMELLKDCTYGLWILNKNGYDVRIEGHYLQHYFCHLFEYDFFATVISFEFNPDIVRKQMATKKKSPLPPSPAIEYARWEGLEEEEVHSFHLSHLTYDAEEIYDQEEMLYSAPSTSIANADQAVHVRSISDGILRVESYRYNGFTHIGVHSTDVRFNTPKTSKFPHYCFNGEKELKHYSASTTADVLPIGSSYFNGECYNPKVVQLNERYADVLFKAANDSMVSGYRCILSKLSPVFDEMFKKKPIIPIVINASEFSANCIKHGLDFYYGKINRVSAHLLELLMFSKKFSLATLKDECLTSIENQMTLENVHQILQTANAHGILELQRICIDYIAEHSQRNINLLPELPDVDTFISLI